MDEELIEFTTENNASVELEDIVESEIVAEDLEQSIETESIIEMAEAEPVEEIEIEVDEAVGWTGGDNTRHYSLYGRDEPDQHPISAITGLRGELDEIGRLKTIYSDGVGLANYYKWHDGVYDDYGYFVSLVQGTNHIQICDGADIFGVTVNMAGFVGNQTATAHGNDYALVATTGLVQVRCESDVAAGDYVVCNSVGVAEKTTSGCGYKVSAVDNSTGVSYAEVSLGVQAHVTDVLKKSVQRLDDRVDEVEINVLYAMNTANTAQNMAQNAINSNGVISDQVSGALEKVESMEQQVGDLSSQVGNIESTAAQAQAVANTASTSAEAARAAAEETANKALVEAEQTRTDVNKKIDDMNVTISNAVDNVEELRETINPLVMWPEGVDPDAATGVAGFVAQANENGVVLGNLVEWKNGNGDDSLAGFVSKATADNAEIQALASYEYTDKDGKKHYGATGIIAGVTDNKAAIDAIVAVDGDIAGLQAQIDENKSAVNLVSKRVDSDYEVVDSWSEEDKDPKKIYYAKDNNTYYYFKGDYDEVEETWTGEWLSTEDAYEAGLPAAVAGIQVVTDDNSSKIENLTSWQGDTNEAMTRIEQKADENGASIQSMVANIDKYSVGEYSQSYGLTYEQAVSILTEGMIYIPTNNFFDCCDQHKDGPSHCETLSHIEYTLLEEEPEDWATNYISYYRYNEKKTKYEEITDETAPVFQLNTYYLGLEDNKINEFTPGCHYVWSKNEKDELDWVEGIGEVVFFSTEVPGQSGDLKYWYIDSSIAPEGYEPYALYIWENEQWIKVNSLEFNRKNRIVSMVQQDVNGLSVEVADARGDVVSLEDRLTNTEAYLKSTTVWVVDSDDTNDKKLCNIAALEQVADDGGSSFALVVGSTEGQKTLKGASIVLGQNSDDSYFQVDADHINLSGYVTFTNLETSGQTTIDGGNITTGILKSYNYDYTEGNTFTNAGTCFKLDNGELRSQNFAIDDSGNAYYNGTLTAPQIVTGKLGSVGYSYAPFYEDGTPNVFTTKGTLFDLDTGSLHSQNFAIDDSGNAYFKGVVVATKGIFDSCLINDTCIINGVLVGNTIASHEANYTYGFLQYTDQGRIEFNTVIGSASYTSYNIGVTQNLQTTKVGYAGLSVKTALESDSNGDIQNYDSVELSCTQYNYANGATSASAGLYVSTRWILIDATSTAYGGYLGGNWTFPTASSTTSDVRRKNSVVQLSAEYGDLFDKLTPVTFKYNDGTSGRTHTGFIAQDVQEAITGAGLTEKDFAAIVTVQMPKTDGSDEVEDVLTLRYEEFIALNTNEIQKLKARVSELEAKIASLTN